MIIDLFDLWLTATQSTKMLQFYRQRHIHQELDLLKWGQCPCRCFVFKLDNKNAFHWDAYRPLQWPPLDISTKGSASGGGACLRGGRACLQGGRACLQGGLPPERGVCLQGGRDGWTEWQMPLKTLPSLAVGRNKILYLNFDTCRVQIFIFCYYSPLEK